jgi:prophage regulatory protein
MPTLETPPVDPHYHLRLYTMKKVCELTNFSRTHIYRKVDAGTFPKPVKLGVAKIGFWQWEVDEWLKSRPRVAKPKDDEPKN